MKTKILVLLLTVCVLTGLQPTVTAAPELTELTFTILLTEAEMTALGTAYAQTEVTKEAVGEPDSESYVPAVRARVNADATRIAGLLQKVLRRHIVSITVNDLHNKAAKAYIDANR